MEKRLEKIALEKEESRKIVKEITSFGVSESQKIDIMYFLSLTLEDNNNMKEISKYLLNFKSSINKEEKTENNIKKIIT